jgi:PAS domain S-box-containing protein
VLAEQLPVKPYTIAEGLAHDEINRIIRDSRGFLWFCTSDGLSRFDGYSFTNYGVKDGLHQQYITDLLESKRDGVYWVATQGGGVGRFDPAARKTVVGESQLFASYPVGDDPATNIVNILYEDRAGHIWAGTNGGLFRLDSNEGGGATFRRVALDVPLRSDHTLEVFALIEDAEGSLWIGTLLGVTRRLPDGRMIHYALEATPTRVVYAFLLDEVGRLWLGYQNGLLVLKPEPAAKAGAGGGSPWSVLRRREASRTNSSPEPVRLPAAPGEASWLTTADGLAHNNVLALHRASDGRIFIGTRRGGLSVFDGERFRNYATAQGLSNTINALAEDHDGNVWVGTQSSGAIKITSSGLVSYREADGLGSSEIFAIFENQASELCVISSKWTLNRFDGEGFTAIRFNLPRSILDSSSGRWVVMQDRAGEWWAATNAGLYRFPKVKRLEELAHAPPLAVYTTRDGLADNYISRLFEDSRGDIWISSFNPPVMLTRWERATGTFHRYAEADGLPPFNWANVFAEDAAGNLWIALHNGGLARFRDGRFELFAERDGVPPGVMHGLYRDRADRLWVATSAGGAARLDDPAAARPRIKTYTTGEDLSSDNLCCFTEDRAEHLYIGTGHGLDRLDLTTGRIKNYTTADGLLKSEVTAAFRDRHDALWFGTREGVSRLIPVPDRPQPPPSVLISGLRIAGLSHPVSELGETEIAGLVLGPSQNQIQIDFFALSFSVGGLRYQYKLEGVDQNWSTPSDQRTVTANLSSGSYRFLVRSVSSDGVTSEHSATVSLTILPPFWRRWWFVTLAALLCAAVVYALIRHRLARLKALRESENRFRTLAETASDAILTIDERSIIIYVNAAAENVFGYQVEEMVGADLTMLMPEYLRHLHRAGLNRYIETSRKHIGWEAVELPGLHKSGREIPLELSFGEFTKGDRRYFTGIARDITERKRTEESLRQAREERLAELRRVRSSIATNLHDDIGSSLTQISILGEVAQQQLGAGNTPATENLTRITNVSNELIEAMSDIVWAINPEKDQLNNLTQRMRRFAHDVFTTRRIEFRFHAPGPEHDFQLGANMRREVFLIFKESVNNMVKHSACSEARIEFLIEDEWLVLRVGDNGKGFDASLLSQQDGSSQGRESKGGNGLLSMRRRAEALGGKYNITSQAGQGTIVVLRAPLSHAQAANGEEHLPARAGGDT